MLSCSALSMYDQVAVYGTNQKISGFVALKLIYNICFRHRGIPTELEFCATDWGIWTYSRSMTTHLKIAELHKKYGSINRISDKLTFRRRCTHPAKPYQLSFTPGNAGYSFISIKGI